MQTWPNPFIEQRADPYILRHEGQYYFIASVPEYDRLAIRRADSLEGLRDAKEVVVWRKPETGPMSQLIWAPELHHIDGKWYIYFAATHTQALDQLGMFQHRMFAIECADRDPLTGTWVEKGQIKTPFDTFALDALLGTLNGDCPAAGAPVMPVLPTGSQPPHRITAHVVAPTASSLATYRLRSLLPRFLWSRSHF